jgi:hypothetical protein
MALYTPQTQRRRRLMIFVGVAFVLGGLVGGLIGRVTAPTPEQRVAQVQEQARQLTAQLRVLSLHAESGAASLGADGDAGSALALRRADDDLARVLELAPWVPAHQGEVLRARLHELSRAADTQSARPAFGADVDRVADDIDATFGLATQP